MATAGVKPFAWVRGGTPLKPAQICVLTKGATLYLRHETVRIVNLTGPGGVGKTRVAIQAATEQYDIFRDGIVFVALAPLRDHVLVLPTIAHTLGLRETGSRTLRELLIEYVRPRNMLLVLDNFEHVVLAAAVLGELLSIAPKLKLLITSRSVLHLNGEHIVRVRPLTIPETEHLPSLARVIESSAVQLFSERARAMHANFTITDENAACLIHICRRLDGLPLALELVAAWTRILPLSAILMRLNSTPTYSSTLLVSGGSQDLPDRQRSLSATINWSYELLTNAERALFRQLAVFVGGCTLAAAEAVLGKDAADETTQARHPAVDDLLPLLASLVDKSLVILTGAQAEPRFTMLETIREYALERLGESGEAHAIQRQLAQYYLNQLNSFPPETNWLTQIATEYDNIQAALIWSLAHREAELAGGLGQKLEWFWFAYGSIGEGRRWLELILTTLTPTDQSIETLAVIGRMAGYFAYFQGDYAHATTLFDASLARFRQLNHHIEVANLLVNQGMVADALGNTAQAHACFEESLSLRLQLDNKEAIADSRYHFGRLTLFEGAYAQAIALLEESITLFRAIGRDYMVSIVLGVLGFAYLAHGRDQDAARCFREAITMLVEQGNTFMIPYNLIGLSGILTAQGYTLRAATLIGSAETLCATTGLRPSPGERSIWNAIITAVRGQLSETEYQTSWSTGNKLTLDQIVAYSMWDEHDDRVAPMRA